MAKRNIEMTPRGSAYAFLAEAIATAVYLPGETIRIADVAHDLGLSATPVREALCRLAGTRVVDDRHREGFRMAQMTSDDVAMAYQVEAHFYATILGALYRLETPLSEDGPALVAGDRPQAFDRLLRHASGSLLRSMAIDLGLRLAPYRRREAEVLHDAAADVTALDNAVDRRDWQRAEQALQQYAASRVGLAHRLHAAGTRRG